MPVPLWTGSAQVFHPFAYRPAPLPDELTSSWLTRLANGMRLSTFALLHRVWRNKTNLMSQDIDGYCPPVILRDLATGCNCSYDAAARTSLRTFVGSLCESMPVRGRKVWILPTSVHSLERWHAGLQFCPTCLKHDAQPYFRRHWRLAFSTECLQHGLGLLDACPTCDAPVSSHRGLTLFLCDRCGTDLRFASQMPSTPRALKFQRHCTSVLAQGYSAQGELTFQRSSSYFALVRQIAKLLVSGPRSAAMRHATVAAWGGDEGEFAGRHRRAPIEHLRIQDRRRLFDLTSRLLDGWPYKFVHSAREARLWKSFFLRDFEDGPYEAVGVASFFLDHDPYKPSEGEVRAAATWLRKSKGYASYADLKALTGESRATLLQECDYLRKKRKECVLRLQ